MSTRQMFALSLVLVLFLVRPLCGLCVLDAAAEELSLPKPLPLVGLHSYAERSVAAGQTIHFRTSSTVPYQLSICRLGSLVDDPSGDEVLHVFDTAEAWVQPIHPGSYVHLPAGLPADGPLKALTVECWVRPFRVKGVVQALISQHDYPSGCAFILFLDKEGRVGFYLGDGGAYCRECSHTAATALVQHKWHHVVGTWDGQTKALYLDGKLAGSWPFAGPVRAGHAPLRFGAYSDHGQTGNLFDGDLAMPVLYGQALSAGEIAGRFEQKALDRPAGDAILACWPLDEERGGRVADVSGHGRHGRIVNAAMWMIGGPSFDGEQVPRYAPYDPAADASRGHGLRLASDALYDCGWKVTHEYRLPDDARSGLYVGRFCYELDGLPRMYHVTFIVRKADDRPRAPILVLTSTNTWAAYNSTPFAATPPERQVLVGTGGSQNSPGSPPAYSCYRDHQARQPAYFLGVNVPWPAAGPYVMYSPEGTGYSHLMRAERFLPVWLEKEGYEYDMITEYDLHRDGQVLEGYKTVVISGHSEYWSVPMCEALEAYLSRGGTCISLSGNSIFWRVSFNEDGTIMECRKPRGFGGGRPLASIGELWHSQDGQRGGLLRDCGWPAWRLIGLDLAHVQGVNPQSRGWFQTELADHFLMCHPEQVGLAQGDKFGYAPGGGVPMAIGHEVDSRLSFLARFTATVPEGATLPDEPPGIVTLARAIRPGGQVFGYFGGRTPSEDGEVGQIIYWERPNGGRVFNTGTIATGWALSIDPKLQALLRNVLFHFAVSPCGHRASTGDG